MPPPQKKDLLDFAFGNFQIQIVNYEEDYLTSPKEDANQFCLGVIASANDHRAFLTSDIDDVEAMPAGLFRTTGCTALI